MRSGGCTSFRSNVIAKRRTTVPVDDPEDLHRLFAELANAGDLQGLTALYEDGAAFVGPDGTDATGSDAIQDRLEGLLAMAPRITPTSSRAVMVGDIALLSNRFHMTLGPSGGERSGLEGTSTEVARRQPDGSWLYVIDDPASSTVLPGASVPTAGDPAAFEQLRYEEDGPIVHIQLKPPRAA
jgi:ketosteroid isomerase-like protein